MKVRRYIHPVLYAATSKKMNVTQMEASAPTDPSNVETDIEFVSWTQKLIGNSPITFNKVNASGTEDYKRKGESHTNGSIG